MKHLKTLAFYVGLLAIAAATAIVLLPEAFSARAKPLPLEAWVARKLRHLAVPAAIRNQMNPVPLTDKVLVEARDHFADHCAICHGNAGSGHTEMGKNFYPNAPDMREAANPITFGRRAFLRHPKRRPSHRHACLGQRDR